MTDKPENDNSEDNVVSLSATATATATASATVTVAFSADNIRERLEEDEYALALVLTATRLENILTKGLQKRLDTNKEQFENIWGNETLGRYTHMCSELGVFEDEFDQEAIEQVVSLRNNLVHDYGYLDDIEEEDKLQQEVDDTIDDAIDFIESVEL